MILTTAIAHALLDTCHSQTVVKHYEQKSLYPHINYPVNWI